MDQYRYRRSKSTQSLQNTSGRTGGVFQERVNDNPHLGESNSDMSYSIYAQQPAAHITGASPPTKKLKNSSLESQLFMPGQRLGAVEPNLSYTRSYSALNDYLLASKAPSSASMLRSQSHNESDEDERFLRLAREALVATATAAKNNSDGLLVDPTIHDLLTRLQYVSSPHGNPIRRSDKIRANENGQLMIQDFYQNFPNLSNDIFSENKFGGADILDHQHQRPEPHSARNEDWNFLIGEPLHLELKESRAAHNQEQTIPHATDENSTSVLSDNSQLDKSGKEDEDRKFLCSKCTMSFRRSSDLKRHEKQHLSIPPNICELCGKGFARKDALKRHSGTLTCKRNADRKLYVENLNYLHRSNQSSLPTLQNYNSGSDW
ncbi:uncharacterized protein AC631_05187 [Debaryomyces fabryi]|uniref:C2H2-type domain-containing protein n=1 Tax=Debaryomyces fabryi TaxID=58627 RepID=A0A0V1PS42_9ASCO|nr:uncharacterized protein AC631_05187 [Debaryomyces fabryi]KRZ99061.1 hypothetical protein AC631_05187 [Debaryomyces fabryi]CUM45392.1 unnamed protein product [Debaryomyces fabryi]